MGILNKSIIKIVKMKEKTHTNSKYVYLLIAFVLIWIVFYEFILSSNFILPRPYFVMLSLGDLFAKYNILINIISTISAIYSTIIAAFIVMWAFRIYLVNGHNIIKYAAAALGWFAGFIPSILIAIFLIYWLGGSEYVKYIFGFFTCFTLLFIKLEDETRKLGDEYIDAAVSLGADNKMVAGKIRWKAAEPALAGYVPEIHLYLWSMIIIIEYIKGGYGLGVVFREALLYKDLPVLFSSALFTLIVIFAGESLIKYFNNKYFSRGAY
jgi:ABC-type nitrate/sulfonate/bicarbonate transport system permease component